MKTTRCEKKRRETLVYVAADARRAFCSDFSLRICAPVSRRFCRAAAAAAARSSRNLTSVEAGAGVLLRSIICSKRSSVSASQTCQLLIADKQAPWTELRTSSVVASVVKALCREFDLFAGALQADLRLALQPAAKQGLSIDDPDSMLPARSLLERAELAQVVLKVARGVEAESAEGGQIHARVVEDEEERLVRRQGGEEA